MRIALLIERGKIAPQRFHREFFGVDFFSCPNAAGAKHRNGRTPALERVLQQEWQDETRNSEKLPVYEKAVQNASERECCGVRLEHALHVPLLIQRFKAPGESSLAFSAGPEHAPLSSAVDSFIEFLGRIFPNSISFNH
jgi:hypothetical protein